uniref:NAD(P)H dehydrogenase (quinone) n=1 Tax=Kalanchoe fedtschenkoi TaxID=63787 RepID=A0A7N0T489_KALFE
MGKGGGSCCSKTPTPISSDQIQIQVQTEAPIADKTETLIPIRSLRVFIVFYSMYGHVELLARRIKKGVDSIEGVEGAMYRVPETLSKEVLAAMEVPAKGSDVPAAVAEELVEADGFLFGFPTRYGAMAAQMKAFFDSTGGLWKEQKLAGIPAGIFVSTGTQGGGQETTAWTAITQLVHHGMLFVPIGYTFGEGMTEMEALRGGTPYGAGAFSGDGSREPSQTELELAEHHGKYMATIVKKISAHKFKQPQINHAN